MTDIELKQKKLLQAIKDSDSELALKLIKENPELVIENEDVCIFSLLIDHIKREFLKKIQEPQLEQLSEEIQQLKKDIQQLKKETKC